MSSACVDLRVCDKPDVDSRRCRPGLYGVIELRRRRAVRSASARPIGYPIPQMPREFAAVR